LVIAPSIARQKVVRHAFLIGFDELWINDPVFTAAATQRRRSGVIKPQP
jgi:hypothetical protein